MDDIERVLDGLEMEDADRLLQREMDFPLDAPTRERIAASVLAKAGIATERRPTALPAWTRWTKWIGGAAAAAAIVATVVFYFIGPGNVTAAIQVLFNFIPGYGIVKTGGDVPKKNSIIDDPRDYGPDIQLSVAELSSAENNEAAMSLKNVIATRDKITVMFSLKRKNITEDQAIREIGEKSAGPNNPKVTLRPGTSAPLNYYTYFSGGGALVTEDSYTFKVNPSDINLDTTYRIEYADYHLFIDFKLKNYRSVETLDEIGPTAAHNDISITAVASQKDQVLTVDLYPINKSSYRIESFTKFGRAYMGQDMHLKTSGGDRAYRLPDDDGFDAATKRYLFDLSPGDKNLVLKIPYLIVTTGESKNIVVEVPGPGKTIALDRKVEFADSTLIVVSAERVENRLKLTLKYDNKSPRTIMQRMKISRIDPSTGQTAGGGGQAKLDENGIFENYQIHNVTEPEGAMLPLLVHDPIYYLLDEYSLKLDTQSSVPAATP